MLSAERPLLVVTLIATEKSKQTLIEAATLLDSKICCEFQYSFYTRTEHEQLGNNLTPQKSSK